MANAIVAADCSIISSLMTTAGVVADKAHPMLNIPDEDNELRPAFFIEKMKKKTADNKPVKRKKTTELPVMVLFYRIRGPQSAGTNFYS